MNTVLPAFHSSVWMERLGPLKRLASNVLDSRLSGGIQILTCGSVPRNQFLDPNVRLARQPTMICYVNTKHTTSR